MTERLILWLVAGPLLLAIVAPMVQTGLPRRRVPIHAIGHLVLLGIAVAALLQPTQSVIVAVRGASLGVSLGFDLSSPVARRASRRGAPLPGDQPHQR